MAEFPSLPVFTDAYLADTRHLTTEEHGAYLLLIMCAWRSPECRLVNDDKKLARMAGLSAAKWRKIKDTISEFFTEKDGFLYQKKLTKIHKNVSKKVQQNQQNGKRGGRPKPLKNKETGKANGYENENPNLTQSEPNQNQNQSIVKDTNKLVSKKQGTKNAKQASRLPDDWKCSPDLARSIHERFNLTPEDIQREEGVFIDYWHGEAGAKARKLDWNAAFRVWCSRLDGNSGKRFSGPTKRGGGSQGAVQQAEALKESAARMRDMGEGDFDPLA